MQCNRLVRVAFWFWKNEGESIQIIMWQNAIYTEHAISIHGHAYILAGFVRKMVDAWLYIEHWVVVVVCCKICLKIKVQQEIEGIYKSLRLEVKANACIMTTCRQVAFEHLVKYPSNIL